MPVTVKGTFQNREREQFHPNIKRKVVAAADVAIKQVQLIDKKGQIRSVVLWQCGTDVLYATTMDGLFDEARRRPAPKWVVEQLSNLPPDKVYSYTGNNPSGDRNPIEPALDHTPDLDDDDVPEFVQK